MQMADKSAYQTPTLFDFQRNLASIIHSGEQEVGKARSRILSEMAAKGLARSGATISQLIQNADEVHKGIIERSMNLIDEFTKTPSQLSREALAEVARPRLETLAIMLANVPTAGSPPVAQQVRTQYTAVFQQRLDGALKDIEIGFINGRRIPALSEEGPVTLGDAVILRPTFMGMSVDIPKAWTWVRSRLQKVIR
jgi:hypothetical protein